MRMPASPRSVRTACSIRPLGRASRRQIDCRDMCQPPMFAKHNAGPRGEPALANASRVYELPVTLRAPPAAPDGAGDGDDVVGGYGHAGAAVINHQIFRL